MSRLKPDLYKNTPIVWEVSRQVKRANERATMKEIISLKKKKARREKRQRRKAPGNPSQGAD